MKPNKKLKLAFDDYVYRNAIEKWGKESQFEQLIEECSELIFSIQKLKRTDRFNLPTDVVIDCIDNLHEEFVDVQIMMNQIRLLLDSDKLEKIHKKKMKRIRKRLNKS